MTGASSIAALFLGAYLVGAIPFGWLVARARGIDIRKHGSGNVGATNVGRVLGRKWGLLVFLLDLAKGASTTIIADLLARRGLLGASALQQMQADFILLGTGVCCVIGNTAPVYLAFRGGKGVATSLGVLLGIWPYLTLPGLAAFLIWVVVAKTTGYVSLASIIASASLPLAFAGAAWLLNWSLAEHYPLLLLCMSLTALVIARHRSNIARLMAGTESRLQGRADHGPRSDVPVDHSRPI